MTPGRRRHVAVVSPLVVAGLVLAAPMAQAAPSAPAGKVTICHRTNALTNPYVQITVAQSSVDGDTGNDRGQGDHYLQHRGDVWTSATTRGQDWGDIIPPVAGHSGLNWDEWGIAIWRNGCRPPVVTGAGNPETTDSDRDGTPDVTDPDDDGDSVPDVTDPDDDNDGTPDTTDLDDNNNGVPDVLDPEEPENRDPDGDGIPDVVDPDNDGDGITDTVDGDDDGDGTGDTVDPDHVTETEVPGTGGDDEPRDPGPTTAAQDSDEDGIPDVRDRDDDNDGVPDRRDGDINGDDVPETREQVLRDGATPPDELAAGVATEIFGPQDRTSAGMRPTVSVRCSPATRSVPAGDVGVEGTTRALCDVDRSSGRVVVRVRGLATTVVSVVVESPASGNQRALRQTFRYVVRP